MAAPKPRDSEKDQDLLKEIRETYTDFDQQWKDIREHSQKCRKYLDGDPWEEEDRLARKKAGRPCINHDELNQYVNQWTGNVRQNKRAIRVNPGGNGSSLKTAEFRQNLIRGIEYRSHAQHAYITMGEQMLEGAYGFLRVSRRYVNRRKNKDQEITISSIANPDSVLYDPYCKQPDGSDAKRIFVLDPIPREQFKRDYPNATIKDFTAEHMEIAKDWLQEKQVLVAEYWRITGDEEDGYKVTQYITNGVEILDERPQPGEHIPIIPAFGKQRYIHHGGQAKRRLYSLVSFALEPQLSLAYLSTQQLEEAGKSPKTPLRGWKGQFETDADALEDLNRVPRSYVQFDYPEWALDRGISLQLPEPISFTPNFQEYEIAKDSARRAIQAAIGSSPLPTAAQRNNEKSGVALERMAAQQDLGSFHFTDNYDRALEYAGRVIEEWIPVVYDTERDIALRLPDDSHRVVRINTAQPYQDEQTGEQVHYPVGDDGEHDLEVSTGPSYASQREEAASFLDTLIQNIQTLPVAPPQAAKLLALAIQMRQLGPKGDEMAEIISPTDNTGQSEQQLQQAVAQAQQSQLVIQELQQELQKLKLEKAGKVIDNQFRYSIEKMKIEAAMAESEINTKAQILSERLKWVQDIATKLGVDNPHEAAITAMQQAHEGRMADLQAQRDQLQQQMEPEPDQSQPEPVQQ